MEESKAPLSILLLDDDKFLVEIYGEKFTKAGCQVRVFVSVKEALDTLRKGFRVDAVIFDVLMPECSGLVFLRQVIDEHLAPGAALIALSNQNDLADEQRAKAMGADFYIVKASRIPAEVISTVLDAIKERKRKTS